MSFIVAAAADGPLAAAGRAWSAGAKGRGETRVAPGLLGQQARDLVGDPACERLDLGPVLGPDAPERACRQRLGVHRAAAAGSSAGARWRLGMLPSVNPQNMSATPTSSPA
jgi:hypothetical protein